MGLEIATCRITGGAKANYIFGMVSSMQARGIPIDGVGFQAHLRLSDHRANSPGDIAAFARKVNQTIGRAAAMGLEVHITEMDVACDVAGCNNSPPSPELFQEQAELYAAVLEACLTYESCRSLETWGITDAHTWLDLRSPGKCSNASRCRPLPFDQNYEPKPAFWALVGVLNGTAAERQSLRWR